MKWRKGRLFKTVFWNVLLGSAIVSKATASVVYFGPPQASDLAWQDFRREVENKQSAPALPQGMLDMLASVETTAQLRELIWASYEITDPALYPQLDDFWGRVVAERGEMDLLQQLAAYRHTLPGSQPMTRNGYLQSWLWKAHHSGGHYDCGGGNGPNTSPPGGGSC